MERKMNKYTVKIHREYIRLVRDWLSLGDISKPENLDKLHENTEKANEYLIKELFWISLEEIEAMEQSDYATLLDKIEEVRNPQLLKD